MGVTSPTWGKNGILLDGSRLLYPCGIFCSLYSLTTLEVRQLAWAMVHGPHTRTS